MLLTTSHLRLRPLITDDAENFYALNADPEVMRFVPDLPFADLVDARSFLENYRPGYAQGFGRLAVIRREDDAWLGWCGLKRHPDGTVDLGFRFHRRYWGQGYATEAAMACLSYGFQELGLSRIVGHAAHGNLASQRVLEKVGMERVGAFKEADWEGVAFIATRV